MANETKAIMASVIPKERPYTTATPHLCIPAAEAREFLSGVLLNLINHQEDTVGGKAFITTQELLAKLPEEE